MNGTKRNNTIRSQGILSLGEPISESLKIVKVHKRDHLLPQIDLTQGLVIIISFRAVIIRRRQIKTVDFAREKTYISRAAKIVAFTKKMIYLIKIINNYIF